MWLGSCLEFKSRLCAPKLIIEPCLFFLERSGTFHQVRTGRSLARAAAMGRRQPQVAQSVAMWPCVFCGSWHVIQVGLGAKLRPFCGRLGKTS